MKLKSIYWLSLSCILLALTACNNDPKDPVDPPLPPPEPQPELTSPKDLVVSVRQAKKVVVEWVGDETATSFEVEMAGRTVELEGTSCGMYVNEDTDYTWRVRAIRGEETTEWVTGPPFRTLVYDDPRIDWIGYWSVDDWNLTADISDIPVPLDDLMDLIPDEIIDAIEQAIVIRLTAPDEESEIPDYDELLITFDLLEELGLPEIATVMIHEKMFSMDRSMAVTLDYPGLPQNITEIPFLSSIPGLGSSTEMMIEALQLELTELQFSAGPIEGGTMPFTGMLVGNISLRTDDPLINVSLSLLKPKFRLTFVSDVVKM